MGYKKQYFKLEENSPLPLTAVTESRVRFEEVDMLGIVWHGRYLSYFEDGRIAFGDKYGLNYQTLKKNRTVAPVVQMHVDFKHSLRFDEKMTIETRLHWSDAVKLNFEYIVYNAEGVLAASGYTVQLFTEIDGNVMFVPPQWFVEFKQKWRQNYWENV